MGKPAPKLKEIKMRNTNYKHEDKQKNTVDILFGIEKELYMIISSFEGESPEDSTQGRVYALYDKVISLKNAEGNRYE